MSGNSTGTGNPGGGPNDDGIQAAAAAFLNLLEEPDEANQEQEGANQDDDTEEQPAEAEASDEAEEQDEADEEEESEPADEESEDETPEASQTFTVTIDGKDEQVSLEELRLGYQRTADYTRKTQALAQARKEHEAEFESVRAERAEYVELLPKLRAALEAGMGPEPDWDSLRQADPVRASLLWQQREDQRRALAQVKAEEERARKTAAEDQAREDERKGIEQRNLLLQQIPEWKDEKVATKEAKSIREQLAKVGYAENERALTDYRQVVLARKAMLYDQMIEKRNAMRGQPPADTVPIVKSGKRPKAKGKLETASARLQKTGSVRDAAAVFANLL